MMDWLVFAGLVAYAIGIPVALYVIVRLWGRPKGQDNELGVALLCCCWPVLALTVPPMMLCRSLAKRIIDAAERKRNER